MNKKYKISISYVNGKKEIFEIETPNIKWTMDQYQRNRVPFTYNILNKKEKKDELYNRK